MLLPHRIQSPVKTRLMAAIGALVMVFGLREVHVVAQPPAPPSPVSKGAEKPKSIGGFGEAPRGDVPRGNARNDDARDRQGDPVPAWPGWRSAEPDGSYGRGRIGATSR